MGLFGSSGGYSKRIKNNANNAMDRYWAALQGMFGPDALRRQVSGYAEDFDRNLAGQAGAYGRAMGARGFAGGPNMGLIRAGNMAGFRANAARGMDAGYLQGLQGYGGMVSQFAPMFYRQPTQGVLGGLAGMAGNFLGMSGGGGGGMVGNPPFNPSGVAPGSVLSFPGLDEPGLPWRLRY